MSTQLASVAADTTPAATRPPAFHRLTRDQIRLLHMLADGLTHDQMATRVGCHTTTARARLHRAYQHLGASNGPHAVAILARSGLLPGTGKAARL
ncbi:sigma factor-like helix-turn-helix DNA-binding protein [Micromonospora robiginosa]|uniref:LuxR C-terminal-related transcriptional regulator n=1 Tax=Micromonospora robiginosa TaxID=2749844 RepID=A0A7L6B7N0_9ACTN|nr:sigma factor-like helix-turn-helix DNA-binding protein [Micromonospora ferruginea]QLQ37957.1 LuxR C-terminal-related transcriptional regulator [Micromonospora ferruginea]